MIEKKWYMLEQISLQAVIIESNFNNHGLRKIHRRGMWIREFHTFPPFIIAF